MHQDKAELYVQIVPLTNADHKKISRNKNNPLQRIKVLNNTTLHTIASYIKRLTATSNQSQFSVSLHVPFKGGCVQLPLSMSVADFLLITSQEIQGELRYKFSKCEERNHPPPPVVSPPVASEQISKPQQPLQPPSPLPPQKAMTSVFPKIIEKPHPRESPPQYPIPEYAPPSIGTDSMNSIFHTGFHLFSNSFGGFPPNLDSISYNQSSYESEKAPSDESISLKKDLELILRK
ncbi:hypothetical protein TRFO_29769 [Tritrichomonas foetus]|uniref:Uncharacterized protein n=1 Tax=Tritrichomonas foetus TaxID=1144522 RepID=A0A1J4K0B6_9EUKA|nr:hypothetical protein TRFO_29769 [Tritrichomonas foetus]|eukprot:OHT02957.1 hypothetical protein TRFO_29769 [Tritrichomonas foetus]